MFGTPQTVQRALQPVNVMLPGQLPVGGINARDALARMPPDDAVDLINVVSGDTGIAVRGGFQEYATNIGGGAAVKTIMSFYPASASQSSGALTPNIDVTRRMRPMPLANVPISIYGQVFACTGGQIFDVTAGGPGPWVAQAGVLATSDVWSWINYQNAGGNFLAACNLDGGYYVYGDVGFSDGFSDGFATATSGFAKITGGTAPGQINGINPDVLVFIMVWKRRIWFIEKESSRAWYLPVDQLTGTAKLFDFGTQFRHGGRLESLISWTVDGGEGIDDYLVVISSEGDVVVFKGYDPDSADSDPNAFQLHGIWYVGAVPPERRFADPVGGDVFILSVTGLSQISKLIAMGQIAAELAEDDSGKIDPYIRSLMQDANQLNGWFVKLLPHEQMSVIGVPELITGQGPLHLAYKHRQKAWTKLLDLPIYTYTNHSGVIFGGGSLTPAGADAGGKVFLMFDNALDYGKLDDPASGNMIKCRVTPAYNAFGSPGMLKRYTMIRPTFVTAGAIKARINILTDYANTGAFNTPTIPSTFGDRWNEGIWNAAVWSGISKPIRKWLGVTGSGYAATAQIDFVAVGGTVLNSIDWNVIPGGPL